MKKRRVPSAVQAKQQPPKPNPFELKGSKRKFSVLGKPDNSSTKNVTKQREEAVNKRKKTLLVEYKQLRKANTFIDRRFGEDDPCLDEEDKVLARFQAQRIKEAKKAAQFRLNIANNNLTAGGLKGSRLDTLTHGGRTLEELEELNSQPAELLGDLHDDILEDLVQQYHFGGRAAGDEGDDNQQIGAGQQRKTKKQIMEEIIAKSKAAKAQCAKQKAADEQAMAQLDDTFRALVANTTGGLGALVKAPGSDKGRKLKPDTDEDAAYDRAARELVFEAKGQASDRTLTREELEEKEAARLAALEAARLKRMQAESAADQEDGDEGADDQQGGQYEDTSAAAQGGYAAKRARLQRDAEQAESRQRRRLDASGDALGENFALNDEDEGESSEDEQAATAGGLIPGSALEARRQSAAAGDHPLQKAFRQAAAKLAGKYVVKVAAESSSEKLEGSEGTDDDIGNGSGVNDEGESGDEAVSGSANGVQRGEGEDDGSEQDVEGDDYQGERGSEGNNSEGNAAGAAASPADDLPHPTKVKKQQLQQQQQPQQEKQQQQQHVDQAHAAAAAAELDGPLDLSYTPAVPETYQEFAALVAGRPAEHLQLAIQRIRAFNAAALATDNKRRLQVFYGILVQHFAMLAGEQPVPAAHLDILTQIMLQLAPEVPFYAATVARMRLEKLHDRLSKALANPLAAGPLLGWPGSRQIMQLRLFSCMFPTSDKRHPVTTPLALLLGKYLMQCPVTCPYLAAAGLLVAGMALHNASAAARFCPEVVNFLAAAFSAFVPPAAAGTAAQSGTAAWEPAAAQQVVSLFTPGLLALDCCKAEVHKQQATDKHIGSNKQKKQQQQHPKNHGQCQHQQHKPRLQLYQLLSQPTDATKFGSDTFKLQLLHCAVATASRACQLSSGCGDAVPQVLQPLTAAVAAVAQLQKLPESAAAAVVRLQQQLQETSAAVMVKRKPLLQSHRVKTVIPREFNPRFETDFALNKDFDPDRQRSQARKLQRQLVKEKRGAMRELRRDAAFMAAERDADKARVDAERLTSERAFYSELQMQEADAKSGGQRGMNPHKRKKRNK